MHKWIEAVIIEIQELSSKNTESVQLIDSLKHKNSLLNKDLEQACQEQASIKSKELMLKSQIESSSQENAYLRESLRSQVNSLQQEILSLRNNIQGLYEENDQQLSKNRSLSNELNQMKAKFNGQEQAYQLLDKKLKVLISEKQHLENLLANYKNADKN